MAYLYSLITDDYMPKVIDLTGQKFGMLTVVEFIGRKNFHSWFRCECKCGGQTVTTSNNLRRFHTTSCGCYNEKMFRESTMKHGLSKHKLFRTWTDMKNRCYFNKHNRYEYYGGKGIEVCELWLDSFLEFYWWGIREGWKKGLSLDRKDNSKNYCPDNCKWSTVAQQNRNRTSNVRITIDGVTKILIEWSEITGIKPMTIKGRLKRGWSPKEAVYTPIFKPVKK